MISKQKYLEDNKFDQKVFRENTLGLCNGCGNGNTIINIGLQYHTINKIPYIRIELDNGKVARLSILEPVYIEGSIKNDILSDEEIDDLLSLLLSENLINKKLNNWEYCINELNQNYFSSNFKLAKFWKYRNFEIPNYNKLKKEVKICTVRIFYHWLISSNRNIMT